MTPAGCHSYHHRVYFYHKNDDSQYDSPNYLELIEPDAGPDEESYETVTPSIILVQPTLDTIQSVAFQKGKVAQGSAAATEILAGDASRRT